MIREAGARELGRVAGLYEGVNGPVVGAVILLIISKKVISKGK